MCNYQMMILVQIKAMIIPRINLAQNKIKITKMKMKKDFLRLFTKELFKMQNLRLKGKSQKNQAKRLKKSPKEKP